MKKLLIVYPLAIVFFFALAYFSQEISIAGIAAIPLLLYIWIRKRNADIWLNGMSPSDRIIFVALENKEMIPFVGKKVSEEYAKIGDKYVKTHRNTAYVYAGKVLMLASQRKNVTPEVIYKLKSKLGESLLNLKLLWKGGFWKCMGVPLFALALWIPPIPTPLEVKWIFLLFSPFVALVYAWTSGAWQFAESQGGREITTFYFSGARKMEPLTCPLMSGGYVDMPGHGNLRLADNTDYFFGGRKVFLSARGVNHTFSLELARKATWFRSIGLRDKYDLRAALHLIEEGDDEGNWKNYNSLEAAYREKGAEFIRAARELAEKKKREIALRPRLIRFGAPRKRRGIGKLVGRIPNVPSLGI